MCVSMGAAPLRQAVGEHGGVGGGTPVPGYGTQEGPHWCFSSQAAPWWPPRGHPPSSWCFGGMAGGGVGDGNRARTWAPVGPLPLGRRVALNQDTGADGGHSPL